MSGQHIASRVTATVTTLSAGAGLYRAANQNASFMERVLPWPGPDGPGWANLHWKLTASDGKPRWRGQPFKTADKLAARAERLTMDPNKAEDIYFCLSIQAQADTLTLKDGRQITVARRDAGNATLVKAIWIDVDVKDPPKGYIDIPEAKRAISQFCKDANLPLPSALVGSGGGLHVYWISDRPLTVDEWRPYAEGLKATAQRLGLRCDYGVTTDVARILRMPGTFNRKITDNPRPVRVAALGRDYAFEEDLAHLKAIGTPRVTAPVTMKQQVDFDLSAFTGGMASAFLADPAIKYQIESGQGGFSGVDRWSDLPLLPDNVIRECPHFRDAALNRGAGHGQGLWNLTVLASTWFEDGYKWARRFSDGCAGYDKTEGEVTALWERKVTERAERGLGWPRCQAFENEGCKLCTTCKWKGQIRSPLNLATRAAQAVPESGAVDTRKQNTLPVEAILALHRNGADKETLFAALNDTYAVVRYGNEVLIASITADEIFFLKPADFHRMFSNILVKQDEALVPASRLWFSWHGRRHYFGRGVAFEPGGLPHIPNDLLNLWRGFGLEPKQGDWSLMRNHMLNVVCSGNQVHFDYLLRWMAYGVRHPKEPIGVAVAFRGSQGAGKGVVARTYGRFFGRHFAHIANGDQLTGRFNASLATSCAVFLDEALWAGDKRGEGVLKALITEPRLQLEAKFRDPIMVDNCLRIMVASNNDWFVPAGVGDRRWFILDVADTHAGTAHRNYWTALYAEIENGGAAAMFYDLLNADLNGFDVRAVPHTAAKARQQAYSLHGTEAWLYQALHEAAIGSEGWQQTGLTITTQRAYECYEHFSKKQRDYRPDIKDVWSKKMRTILGPCLRDMRTGRERVRSFVLAPLVDCRGRFSEYLGSSNIEWEPAAETVPFIDPGQMKALDANELPSLNSPVLPISFSKSMAQAAADLVVARNRNEGRA